MAQFDVARVGLGAMGKRGALSTRAPRRTRGRRGTARTRHDQGSSHGESRIIRLGYFEHPSYVPLLRRAYALWRELEAASETKLLHMTASPRSARGRAKLWRARSRPAGCMGCRTRSWTRPRPCGAFRRSKSRPTMSAYSSPMAASSRLSPRCRDDRAGAGGRRRNPDEHRGPFDDSAWRRRLRRDQSG